MKFIDVSEMLTAALIIIRNLIMEAISTSETLIHFQQIARRKVPEDNHLHQSMMMFVDLMMMKMMLVVLVVTPCRLVGRYPGFRKNILSS
jgi:FtsH-binding integral membrane protein